MLMCWGSVTSAPASTGFWNWRTCRRRCPMAVKLEPSSLSPSPFSSSFYSSFSSSSPCSFNSAFPLPLLLTLSLPFPLPYPCPRPFTRSPLPPRPSRFPLPLPLPFASSSFSSCSELQSFSEAGFFHFLFFSLLLSLVLFLFRVLFPFLFLSHTFVRVPLVDSSSTSSFLFSTSSSSSVCFVRIVVLYRSPVLFRSGFVKKWNRDLWCRQLHWHRSETYHFWNPCQRISGTTMTHKETQTPPSSCRPVSLSVWRGAQTPPSSCPSCVLVRMARRARRGARRDITRGAGKSKGLGQGGTAEPGSAEPGIHYLRTLDCLQQGKKSF